MSYEIWVKDIKLNEDKIDTDQPVTIDVRDLTEMRWRRVDAILSRTPKADMVEAIVKGEGGIASDVGKIYIKILKEHDEEASVIKDMAAYRRPY